MPAIGGNERHVLVTTCSEAIRMILRDTLEQYGATVRYVEAEPGLIKRLEAEAPALILANIDPFMERSKPLLAELAAAASRLAIPVIAFSEKWRAEDMAAKTRPFFECVLWAPMAMQRLHDLLAEYLA